MIGQAERRAASERQSMKKPPACAPMGDSGRWRPNMPPSYVTTLDGRAMNMPIIYWPRIVLTGRLETHAVGRAPKATARRPRETA